MSIRRTGGLACRSKRVWPGACASESATGLIGGVAPADLPEESEAGAIHKKMAPGAAIVAVPS